MKMPRIKMWFLAIALVLYGGVAWGAPAKKANDPYSGYTDKYTVKPTDTPRRIAEYYGITAGNLRDANKLTPTDTLRVQQVLRVPRKYIQGQIKEKKTFKNRVWQRAGVFHTRKPLINQLREDLKMDAEACAAAEIDFGEGGARRGKFMPGDTLDMMYMDNGRTGIVWDKVTIGKRVVDARTGKPADLSCDVYGPYPDASGLWDRYICQFYICNNGALISLPHGATPRFLPPPPKVEVSVKEAPEPEPVVMKEIPVEPMPMPEISTPVFEPAPADIRSAYYGEDGVIWVITELAYQFDKVGVDVSRDKFRWNLFSGLKWKVIQSPSKKFFVIIQASPNLQSNYYYYGYFAGGLGIKPIMKKAGVVELDAGFWHEDGQFAFRQYKILTDRIHVEEQSVTYDANGYYVNGQLELPYYTHIEGRYEQGDRINQRWSTAAYTEPYFGNLQMHFGASYRNTEYPIRRRHIHNMTLSLPADQTRQQELQVGFFPTSQLMMYLPWDLTIYQSREWRAEERSKTFPGVGFEWRTQRRMKSVFTGKVASKEVKVLGWVKYLERTNMPQIIEGNSRPLVYKNDLLRAAIGFTCAF